MQRFRLVLVLCLTLSLLPMGQPRAERSPVFGAAAVEAISQDAARDITARGFWADYFGSLTVTYAYTAYIYAFYGRNYAVTNSANEQSWYGTAALNAYHAYIYAAWAQYYSSVGM